MDSLNSTSVDVSTVTRTPPLGTSEIHISLSTPDQHQYQLQYDRTLLLESAQRVRSAPVVVEGGLHDRVLWYYSQITSSILGLLYNEGINSHQIVQRVLNRPFRKRLFLI
ncbi:hypothetical protein FRC18_000282 [Serendipita sp. 400]|nr:hypothetical protein FRC18_000282 [Serendipita sp. 400]